MPADCKTYSKEVTSVALQDIVAELFVKPSKDRVGLVQLWEIPFKDTLAIEFLVCPDGGSTGYGLVPSLY